MIREISVKRPTNCSDSELNAFYVMVKTTNQEKELLGNITKCEWLIFVWGEDQLLGTAAVKHPDPWYVEAIQQATELDLGQYYYEVGYRVVYPDYRGNGLGTDLAIFQTRLAGSCWATNRIENRGATKNLMDAGMKIVSNEFVSPNGNYKCRLLVKK